MSDAAVQLESFRRPGGPNSRLAHWDPSERSLRWFKSYLQVAAQGISARERELLDGISKADIGDPVLVTVVAQVGGAADIEVNLDYLYAAEEVAFIEDAMGLGDVSSVCELGAGFGRTAHTILSTMPSVQVYSIIDLEETMALSSAYLRAVLSDELWAKVHFVNAADHASYPTDCDLFIQIDGFQEMDQETIDWYFQSLVDKSRAFYCCNPVGKYEPHVAGVEGVNPEGLEAALKLGRSRSVVDPWNEASLRAVRPEHVRAYCPTGWHAVKASPSRLRAYYHHVLYQRPLAKIS